MYLFTKRKILLQDSSLFSRLPKEKINYFPYFIVSLLEGASIQYLIVPNAFDAFDIDQYFEYCKLTIDSMLRL